jgi:transposase
LIYWLFEKKPDTTYTLKISKNDQTLTLDEKKIVDDEKWDGFYGIQTSKKNMSVDKVLEAYKRLWKIEESFRILKSTLQTRPMFHWSEKRIVGHLVVCFIAFLLQRSLELILIDKKLDHSPEKVRDAIDKMELSIVNIEEQKMYLSSNLKGLSRDILHALSIATPKPLTIPEQF